jgi:hypothetical protein
MDFLGIQTATEESGPITRRMEMVAPDRVRIITTEIKEVSIDPLLAAVLSSTGSIGTTTSFEISESRHRYPTREALMAAKDAGLITGKEEWYRREYMRLSQNERREKLRMEASESKRKRR